jgi:uncharacterized FAD-dependent dehydrogenase
MIPRAAVYLRLMASSVKSVVLDIRFPVQWIDDEQRIRGVIAQELLWNQDDVGPFRVLRKNLDARKRKILAVWRVEVVAIGQELPQLSGSKPEFVRLPNDVPSVHVVGAGPAGLFAALRLIQLGVRPIVLERGQPVRQRRRDLVRITRDHEVDADSNYCFGEGGAGTYSDGKLYTRSHKRGDIQGALQWLVHFGADPNILVEAHPHIGTNKLPQIIERMREAILAAGGEVHFGCRLVDVSAVGGTLNGVVWQNVESGKEQQSSAEALILATGHSAKDVFELFERKKWRVEAKPFAMGVRIEHPQALIDTIQYHGQDRGNWLPPASYRLVCQASGRGVHSFCMCPGGIIAPCATDAESVVTNGWSPSKRNNPFANSGMVVQLTPEDWEKLGFTGPLGGLKFQREVERKCWEAAGQTQRAPAQRLVDFLKGESGVQSSTLPTCSYVPGVVSVNLWQILPSVISNALASGLKTFVKRMPNYLHPDAILVAPESRTSSPVRIPRDGQSLMHPDVAGLFPCGEGGGYAGGILSAALDGLRVADSLVQSRLRK